MENFQYPYTEKMVHRATVGKDLGKPLVRVVEVVLRKI